MPDVLARLQHPLRADRPAAYGRCDHGRAQGARCHGAPAVRGRERCPRPHCHPPGLHRQCPQDGACLCKSDRGDPCGRARDELPRGDRDRPVRGTGRALRRDDLACQGGVRDAGQCRVLTGDGIPRGTPRAQAHRRPDLRGGAHQHAQVHQQHRAVRRPDPGAPGDRPRGLCRDAADP